MRRVELNFFEEKGDFVESVKSAGSAVLAPFTQGDTIEFAVTKMVKPARGEETLDRIDLARRQIDARGGDDQRGRGRELPSWDDVHAMTSSELDAMAEAEGVNPSKFDSDEALAGAICDKMGIERKPRRHSPDRDSDERPSRGRGDDDDGDEAERLAKMRRGRDGDDERPTRRTRGD